MSTLIFDYLFNSEFFFNALENHSIQNHFFPSTPTKLLPIPNTNYPELPENVTTPLCAAATGFLLYNQATRTGEKALENIKREHQDISQLSSSNAKRIQFLQQQNVLSPEQAENLVEINSANLADSTFVRDHTLESQSQALGLEELMGGDTHRSLITKNRELAVQLDIGTRRVQYEGGSLEELVNSKSLAPIMNQEKILTAESTFDETVAKLPDLFDSPFF